MLFAEAQAQVLTYTYTGTKTSTPPTDDGHFGNTVTGTITVDLAAHPNENADTWRNVPFFKITAQATNFSGGTATSLDVDDTVYRDSSPIKEFSWFGLDSSPSGFTGKNIKLIFTSTKPGVSDPKNDIPLYLSLNAATYDVLGDLTAEHNSDYSVTLTAVTTNLIIDGLDTGISDFNYQGQPLSVILDGFASSAKNHGDYVRSVEKLADKLVKAKLLTRAQAKTLTQAAAKSSIGKKPKKDKDCKDKDEDND